MGREDVLKRLEALNRGPLHQAPMIAEACHPSGRYPGRPAAGAAPASEPDASWSVQMVDTAAVLSSQAGRDQASNLDTVVPGEVREAPGGGHYWLVEKPVPLVADWCGPTLERVDSALSGPLGVWLKKSMGCSDGVHWNDLLFVDLETTGLENSPLFLIGTIHAGPEGLIARQYLARNFEEEASVLRAFANAAQGFRIMVTFNGLNFDGPFLLRRAASWSIPLKYPTRQLDLLLTARRHYRGKLPNCKLQTLEQHLCGRQRVGDIPGSEIPSAYHEFVATGDAARMASILHHNILDMVTMIDLLDRLCF